MDVTNEFGLSQEQQVDLPPPGDERREVLKERTDNLQQQIDEKADHYAIDPAALEVDREIRHDLDQGCLTPSDADPAYKYAWVQCKHPEDHPSRMVELKLAERVQLPDGNWVRPWEVVGSKHKEALNLKQVDGSRRIGDTLLMRCRKDYYSLIELNKRKLNHQRNYGTDSALVDLATRAGTEAGTATYNKHKSDANQSLSRLDQAIRTGTLPGMEINRR